MPNFAANLTMLYNEHDFMERFGAAAADGFAAVEYLFPYPYEKELLAEQLKEHKLVQALHNMPAGDWAAGERGIACIPGREDEFRTGVVTAIEYATALGCRRVNCLAGIPPKDVPVAEARRTLVANLKHAAPEFAKASIMLVAEAINTRDIPGFFLNRQDDAHATVQAVGAANLKVQFDLYHCQIVEGDVAMKIRQYLPTGRVGHFQIAGVPERHEPDVGEVNYPYLFKVIDEVAAACGWQGWVGCEYRPARGATPGGTSAGLGWLKAPGA